MARLASAYAGSAYSRCNDVITPEHVNFLHEYSGLLHAFMVQLVTPEFSESVPRAAVYFSHDDQVFRFDVNPDFWAGLSFYEQTFVLAHEILHPLLRHGSRERTYLNERIQQGLDNRRITDELFNIMMDIEINELLVSSAFGFNRKALRFARSTCFVDTVFAPLNVDHTALPTNEKFEYYLNYYLEHTRDQLCLLDLMESFYVTGPLRVSERMDNQGDEATAQQAQAVLDTFFDQAGLTPDDIAQNTSIDMEGTLGFGRGGDGQQHAIQLEKRKSLDEIFRISIKKSSRRRIERNRKTCWTAVNRRLYAVMEGIDPGLSIPYHRIQEHRIPGKHKILVYLDTSGSCVSYVKKLMELVANLPEKKYSVEAYTFSDSVEPVDLNRPRYYSGGTNIDAVYTHATSRIREERFDAVFVLTDGGFSCSHGRYSQLDYHDWYWFLVRGCRSALPNDGCIFDVKT